MRIGIEAQRLFRKKKHGMEVVALELIKNLQKIDLKNQYTIFVGDGEDYCIEESKNFKIKIIRSLSFADWEQIWLPRAIKKANLDILHCTSNTASLFVKVPLILTIHDVIYLESLDFGGSAYQNFGNLYRRIIVPRAARLAKSIITVSDFEKENIIKKLSLPRKKVTTIYNAKSADFKIIKDVVFLEQVKNKYNLPNFFILYFGNTAPRKNTIGVLKAYAKYCELSPDPYPLAINSISKEKISKLIARNNIDLKNQIKNLICLDYVEKIDLPAIYNLSSFFLYPSYREGFGLPIIEAMACGTAVITSSTSSMPEVAGDAAILINPHNPQEIAEAMVELTQNQELKISKIEKGIIQANDFSWERTAERTLTLYNNLVK